MTSSQLPVTYINLLPPNAIANVLRFFSDYPRDSKWPKSINTEHLVTILRENGPLAEIAKERITTLVHFSEPPSEEGSLYSANPFAEILSAFGKFCSSLYLFSNINSPLDTSSWLPQLEKCTNLRQLTVSTSTPDFSLKKVLQAVQGALQDLTLDGIDHEGVYFSSIATHCSGLKRIQLQVSSQNHPSLKAALDAVGPSLLSLHLAVILKACQTSETTIPLDIKGIGRSCPNIRNLEIYGDLQDFRSDVEELSVDYGSQLDTLTLSFCGKNEQFLHDIAACCTNVAVHTDVMRSYANIDDFLFGVKPDPTKTMDLLGPRLASISFRFGFGLRPEFESAAAKCCNLSKLDITDCTPAVNAVLEKLFAHPKPHLVELKLAFKKSAENSSVNSFSNMLSTISKNSGGLQTFVFSGPALRADVYHCIVGTNKRLESVHISMNSFDDRISVAAQRRASLLAGLIATFSSCPILKHIFIMHDSKYDEGKIAEVEKACFKIRSRRISVNVQNIWYLQ